MSTFLDTSALYAVISKYDPHHRNAKERWVSLIQEGEELVSNNYVILEILSLLQKRLGIEVVRAFLNDIYPLLRIAWLDEAQHQQAISALLAANRRELSLVDCASFITMRHLGLRAVFAFDPQFAEQGFDCLP
jgi:predicted nucleic acid-binding protein